MATDHHIHKFSAADIERYHQGKLSVKERHDLEKAALDDPFLADALEGYGVASNQAMTDLAELRKRLAERTAASPVVSLPANRRRFSPMLRAAAMLIVMVGAGLLVYQFAFNKKTTSVAQVKPGTDRPADNPTSSNPPLTGDSTASSVKVQPAVKENTTAGTNTVSSLNSNDNNVTLNKPETTAGETRSINNPDAGKELKPVSTGGAPAPAPATTTAKPNDVPGDVVRSLSDDKENAREETKSKTPARNLNDKEGIANQGIAGASPGTAPANKATDQRARQDLKKENDNLDFKKKTEEQFYRNQAMNTFRGRVTDANNTGLPFANVTNTRDNVGTYSDANGYFALTSPDSVLNVQVRSVGFDNNNTLLRNGAASNQVVMQEDRKSLSEVVVSTQKPNSENRAKDVKRSLVEPEPVDGWVKYDSYLANNLNVPEDYNPQPAATNYVQVSFEVDKYGEPVNIRIEKSLCPSCDEEAKRLVKAGPKFKRNANKKGRTTVTINF